MNGGRHAAWWGALGLALVGALGLFVVAPAWRAPTPKTSVAQIPAMRVSDPEALGAMWRRVPFDELPVTGKGFGGTWADFDRDGRLDLLLSLHGGGVGAYRNRGGLHFDRLDTCVLFPCTSADHHGTAACDFDADGDWEFYVSVGADLGQGQGYNELWDKPVALAQYRNSIGRRNLLADPQGRGRGALWIDLDGDIHPELVVLNYMSPPRLFHPGGGLWVDWSDRIDQAAGSWSRDGNPRMGYWRSVSVDGDFDGDGRSDLYLAGVGVALLRNLGGGRLRDDTESAGLEKFPETEAGAATGDVDNDGDLDLLCIRQRPGSLDLWLNESAPDHLRFRRGPDPSPLASGMEIDSPLLADFDNDGILDLYLTRQIDPGTNGPNLAAKGAGDGTFTDMGETWGGTADVPALPCGVWAVDLDNDGDLELLALHGKGNYPERRGLTVLYENTCDSGGLTVILASSTGPPHGLGAVVRLASAAGTATPSAHQTRQVRASTSYWNSTVLPLHFGVGRDPGPFIADIAWPGGRQQRLTLPRAGAAYRITEGKSDAVTLPKD